MGDGGVSAAAPPRICEVGGKGLIFPIFGDGEANASQGLRAVLYFCGLVYCFMGVNIVADYFMNAIEMITSAKKRIRDPKTGRAKMIWVWNSTVANLTLLALGSSAPEILLSLVDSMKERYFASKLGPGTIVGSAAFNLLMIVPVCMLGISDGSVRRIKQLSVYYITAVFSLFAYTWLYLVVTVISPERIEVWEAVVTLALMPILVLISYIADIAEEGERQSQKDGKALLAVSEEEDGSFHMKSARARKSALGLQKGLENAVARLNEEDAISTATAKRVTTNATRRMSLMEGLQLPAGDDGHCIRDTSGKPIQSKRGILTFDRETFEVPVSDRQTSARIPVLRRNGVKGVISCKYHTEKFTAVPDMDYKETKGLLTFDTGETTSHIEIDILPKKAGQRNDQFLLTIDNAEGGAIFNPNDDGGKESSTIMVQLVNLQRLKNSVDGNRLGSAVAAIRDDLLVSNIMQLGCQLWADQIAGSCRIEEDDDEDEDGSDKGSDEGKENKALVVVNYVLFFLALPWKVLYAFVSPPAIFCSGWVLFFVAMGHIGALTTLVCDLASLLGCVLDIDDTITAITIVALGTSLPDLFASYTAAQEDEYADASIINVTGSNSVNVFLGIGLPWLMCSLYWQYNPDNSEWDRLYGGDKNLRRGDFVVRSGSLGFSVAMFTALAIAAFILMRVKRVLVGGELGGPAPWRFGVALTMMAFWVLYIVSTFAQSRNSDLEGTIATLFAVFCGVAVCGGILFEFAMVGGAVQAFKEEEEEEQGEKEEPENVESDDDVELAKSAAQGPDKIGAATFETRDLPDGALKRRGSKSSGRGKKNAKIKGLDEMGNSEDGQKQSPKKKKHGRRASLNSDSKDVIEIDVQDASPSLAKVGEPVPTMPRPVKFYVVD
eukprot:TRINITY_DN26536_c0_g1_i1.p1 TRINITY_DN26536_c0_g1~~TRINITY_DN26536_c0_g1_i1.p1  ORF type:complete len:891 (-),score=216.91 TRINITY_DN26536_c0_g1_i1:98-2770(-)